MRLNLQGVLTVECRTLAEAADSCRRYESAGKLEDGGEVFAVANSNGQLFDLDGRLIVLERRAA